MSVPSYLMAFIFSAVILSTPDSLKFFRTLMVFSTLALSILGYFSTVIVLSSLVSQSWCFNSFPRYCFESSAIPSLRPREMYLHFSYDSWITFLLYTYSRYVIIIFFSTRFLDFSIIALDHPSQAYYVKISLDRHILDDGNYFQYCLKTERITQKICDFTLESLRLFADFKLWQSSQIFL